MDGRRHTSSVSDVLWLKRPLVVWVLALPLMALSCQGPAPFLPECGGNVEQEPTGDLATDIVGAWSGSPSASPEHHPIAHLGQTFGGIEGHRVWMFRSDGSGHVWYGTEFAGGAVDNDVSFLWRIDEEGLLVVDDLPPGDFDIGTPVSAALFGAGEPRRTLSLIRCDLVVPDGIRGLDR